MNNSQNTVQIYTISPTNNKKYNLPPPPTSILLHTLDLSAPLQIRLHRFFHRPPSTFADIIDKLKCSLAEALELYPPVAGIVQANEEGEDCVLIGAGHNQGVPFLVATKDTAFMGDTEDLAPRPDMFLPPSSSTLAVKVTQFSCGTVAVAASMHHQVADFSGFLDFLAIWAQIARGETINLANIPSDWSRTPGRFFSGLATTPSKTPPPGFIVHPAPPTEVPEFFTTPSEATRWRFSKSAIEELKCDFSPSTSSEAHKAGLWISSGDAISALLWGVITRSRENANVARVPGRSSLESQIETMLMAADGRDRSPQGNMTNGQYFGNFNPLYCAAVPRSDLMSVSFEAASRVALAIREALNLQLSPEAIAQKISFMEDPENTKPPGRIGLAADVILTNWSKFDFKGPKLDFGWGKPFSAVGGVGLHPAGYVILTQNKVTGDIFAKIAVEQVAAARLRADSLLNKYAEVVTEAESW